MNRNIDGLCQVVAAALAVPGGGITRQSSMENVAAWSSVGHLQVLMAVESAFGVHFRTEEMFELASIEALAKRLEIR